VGVAGKWLLRDGTEKKLIHFTDCWQVKYTGYSQTITVYWFVRRTVGKILKRLERELYA